MRMIRINLLSILFSFFIFSSCTGLEENENTFFNDYIERVTESFDADDSVYLLINKKGCLGCVQKATFFLINNPQVFRNFNKVIYTKSVLDLNPNFAKQENLNIYCDTSNILDNIDLGVNGVSIFFLKNNQYEKKSLDVRISSSPSGLKDFFLVQGISDSQVVDLTNDKYVVHMLSIESDSLEKIIMGLNRESNPAKGFVIFFTSNYCSPCKKMEPILDSLSKVYDKKYSFYRFNVTEKDNMKTAIKYKIKGTPTLWIVDKDKKIKKMLGFMDGLTLDSIMCE